MAKEKKVEQITDMEVDFAQWYTDICRKAELVEYSSVKGFTILRPYGYAIWENMQKIMDGMFKETGHENVAMPVLIPESLLKKEGELVKGFAPEVAWVTHGGNEKLEERLAFRPTSETMFSDFWANTLQTYRELPMLYNQWCSVIRWEKTTRPFLRSREFWWQEGHTIHETAEEAQNETMQQLRCYADFFENVLAIPVVPGRKTDKEKFAGAEATYTVECMMKDRKALQGATSHYFGDKFSRAYGITFTGRDNKLQHPYQTSWGSTTRMIGAVIMTHGDNNGLVLPPKIAPIQIIVLPIAQHKPGVLEGAAALEERLKKAGFRVKTDKSDNSMGWKCAQYEMKGVPLRVECGPRDLENGQCILVRRTDGEKITVKLEDVEAEAAKQLELVQQQMYDKAKKNLEENIYPAYSLEGGQAASKGARRLHQDHVVRRRGLRNQDEGGGRHVLPVHAPHPGAFGRRVPHLRQARQDHDLLGRGLLSRGRCPHRPVPRSGQKAAGRQIAAPTMRGITGLGVGARIARPRRFRSLVYAAA